MFQLDGGDAELRVTEVEKAKLEPFRIVAFGTEFGRHLERKGATPGGQFGSGKIGPSQLEPDGHKDLDPEHGLRGHPWQARLAAKAEPIGPCREMQIGPVKKAPALFSPAHS